MTSRQKEGKHASTSAGDLGVIKAVTIAAPDVAAAETAWTEYLGYRLIERGNLDITTATAWGASALHRRRYVIVGPASGERTYLRFVEQSVSSVPSASLEYGWRTAEITVQDSDALYARLQNSPFAIPSAPCMVPTYPYLHAMDAIGPSGERLAFTWIKEVRQDLAVARSSVGRCFIVVLSVPDLCGAVRYYHDTFGNPYGDVRELPEFNLSVVTLAGGAKLEIDEYPCVAHRTERHDDHLPPGIALVSFECSNFDRYRSKMLGPVYRNRLQPCSGARAGLMEGAAGELIELIDGDSALS